MKKVLHVIPSLAAAHGGPSRAMRLIERALREQGVETETATTDDDGAGGRNGKLQGTLLLEEGAERRYFPKTSNPYKTSIAFARWIFRHARDYELIHIHALFSFTSTVAAWAARRAGVPYVIRPLGTLSQYGVSRRRPWLKRMSMALIERRLLRDAAAVHFTSATEQQEAEALGLSMRSVVIPLAVEPAVMSNGDALLTRFPELKDKRCVLFLSRLDPKKNVEGLLAAVAVCATELPNLRCLIAGAGAPEYVAQLRDLAAQLGVAERVSWAGHLDSDLKAAAFVRAEVFVLPSFSENFGIAAAEALAAGLPCVLGRGVAIAGELADAGAALVVDADPASIAAALNHLLQDDALRTRMARAARKFALENYSVAAMGLALRGLYSAVLLQKNAE
jgi:glycosyltransferase involved in cell wall biosynthesis